MHSYEVVPIQNQDAIPIIEGFIVTYCLQLDGVMEPEKLRRAMYDLVIKRWKIIGARIGKNAQTGKYEYRVPQTFDESNPPILFTSREYDMPLEQHQPRPKVQNSQITVHEDFNTDALFNPRPAMSLKDYLTEPPRPVMSIHVSLFTDTTLVGIMCPHGFNDGAGMSTIIRAWAECVNYGGVPPSLPELPLKLDHLNKFFDSMPADMAQTPAPHGYSLVKGWNGARLLSSMLWELLWEPKETTKLIHIPRSEVNRLRVEAQAQSKLKLSLNDVLMAWAMKACFGGRSKADHNKPVYASSVLDMRQRIPEHFAGRAPYLHNCIYGLVFDKTRTISEIQTLPLATLAEDSRRTVLSVDKETISRDFAWFAGTAAMNPLPVKAPGQSFLVTSWLRLGLVGTSVNFAGALRAASGDRNAPSGKICQLQSQFKSKNPTRRFGVFMTDGETGGCWVRLTLPEKDWERGVLGSFTKAN